MAKITVFSENELLMIALILDEEEKEEKVVKKRIWVHKTWTNRPTEGKFCNLYKELMDDEPSFLSTSE